MNNFLVTSLGRCGTMFLAQTLDKSPSWTIEHEVPGDSSRCQSNDFPTTVNQRQQDRRGEFNSYLRFSFPHLKAGRRAVILREPNAIVRSALNKRARWRKNAGFCRLVREVAFGLQLLDRWIELKHVDFFMRFEDLFADSDKVLELAHRLGVTDLESHQIQLSEPVNQRPTKYADLSVFESSNHLLHTMDWFRSKYYP